MNRLGNHRRILVADDNPAIHDDFRNVLTGEDSCDGQLDEDALLLFGDDGPAEAGQASRPRCTSFEVDTASQGRQAVEMLLEAVHEDRPYTVAFIDGRMPPGWDGVETIEHLWEVDPRLQVVFCTAYSDYSSDEIVDRLGETDRLLIIKKPFDPEEIRLATSTLNKKWHLERQAELREGKLEQMVAARTRVMADTRDLVIFGLAKLAELRDNETGEHLERMREYSQNLAEQLRSDGSYADRIDDQFLDDLYRSSSLHDIGKVGIRDAILLKPGKLTSEEFEVMKRHAIIGANILDAAVTYSQCGGFLAMAAVIARFHHERWDGKGYPAGLVGKEIPLPARIVSVADVYDALTSVRPYKDALPSHVAKQMIEEGRGTQFDPVIVEAFTRRYADFLKIQEKYDNVQKTAVGAISFLEHNALEHNAALAEG